MTVRIMKTPRSVDLAITSKCNLRCKYCGHFKSAGDVDHDLLRDEWLQFFEELNRYTVLNIILDGGEPFLREDLKDIIEGIIQNRMRFSILSNGTLLTEEMATFLASVGHCDYVQISVDGSIPETHDSCRGAGSFLRAVQGIRILQKHQIPVTARATIHRHNVEDIEGIAKLLLENLGLSNFSINTVMYRGLCQYHANEIQLTVEERSCAMETLLRLEKKYKERISASKGLLAEIKRWIEMERARREGKESIHPQGYLTACGGVISTMAVRADGMLVPCLLLSHIELGQINKNDLREVWRNHPELTKLRKRRNIPLSDFTFCRGCEYIPYCTGGCPALAYTMLGEENHPSPEGCLKRFLEEGGRLPNDSL